MKQVAGPRVETIEHPSGDGRYGSLAAAIKRHQRRQDALIEVLHVAQQLFGYLAFDVLYFIAHELRLPPSRVYAVATFYHIFSLEPKGKHQCVVCTGTACYVNGAEALLSAAAEGARTGVGQTSSSGEVTLLTARCIGACGNAPVVVFDGQAFGGQSPREVQRRVKGWLQRGSSGTPEHRSAGTG
jgi:bidirectional [NiFe] hydrogenase diaphorase subunit